MNYQPSAPAAARVERDGERWVLLFAHDFAQPPERVWSALTDPDQLREWSPFDADRDLAANETFTLTMAGGDGSASSASKLVRAESPRILEYPWDTDVLRWELEPANDGTHLTLRHTMDDPEMLAKVAAGWHICLDILDHFLSGNPLGRLVAGDAKPYWEPLNAAYAEQFSVS